MAVVCRSDLGVVVDHLQYINNIYCPAVEGHLQCSEDRRVSDVKFSFKPEFFEIVSVFGMDSHFEKMQKLESCDQGAAPNKHGKRKRKLQTLNDGEEKLQEFHKRVSCIIHKAYDQLLCLARHEGLFAPREGLPVDNNKLAREASTNAESSETPSLTETSNRLGELFSKTEHNSETDNDVPPLFSELVDHTEAVPRLMRTLDTQFVIPPNCSFLMSDISTTQPLIDGRQYDLIVIDPPWPNKSVKRKKMYKTLNERDFLTLPVNQLAKKNGLVVVWATTKQKQHRFIREELFGKWGVKFLTQWYWLKVTKHGVPVVPLEDPHKKPYETIFLGRFTGPPARLPRDDAGFGSDQQSLSGRDPPTIPADQIIPAIPADQIIPTIPADQIIPAIPADQIIISIPSSIHSHKPPLDDVLKVYLPPKSNHLELFARGLLQNWTCWGNEVLKLQSLAFFNTC